MSEPELKIIAEEYRKKKKKKCVSKKRNATRERERKALFSLLAGSQR